MNILFALAIAMAVGMAMTRLIKLIHLPNLTSYLIAFLLVEPYVLKVLTPEMNSKLSIISDVALGFIAYSIGSEFKLSYFKRVGMTPIVIAIFESFVAVLFVTLGLVLSGQTLPFSLVLGAIAAATAPAATIMVIKQYRAKGPVTETLLSVVAIDDATALIAFGIAVAVAQTLTSTADVSLVLSILKPVLEIAEALLGGALLGVLFTVMLRFFKVQSNRMVLAIAFVLVTSAVANALNISALLTTMAMGAVFANLCKNSSEVMSLCDHVTPPVFMMFFVLSGAGLNLAILPSIGVVGVIYVVLRVMGKMAGAWFGATVMKADHNVRRWLGPALIPQAGVAIVLTVVAQQVVPQYAEVVRAVVLCGTLIYELVGPGVSKLTLHNAGEIEPGQ